VAKLSIAEHGERLVYRIAGLPLAILWLWSTPADPIDAAFVSRYWHPEAASDWAELIAGLALWPVALIGASLWYTARNARAIRRRSGRRVGAQLLDQLRLYFSAGVLAPWYYVFSLHEEPSAERARSFLERFETKPVIFPLLKRRKGSPLNDKAAFAAYCAERGIHCVSTLARLEAGKVSGHLPDADLFVKPSRGRGGRGAERWDRVASFEYSGPGGERLAAKALLDRLVGRSKAAPLIVQPRLSANHKLDDLTTGALPTVRIFTCLNEQREPEVVGAAFRMAIGENVTVDNLHAGGIAAMVDLDSGALSRASNLGSDARLGWLSVHPSTGAKIEGRVLPLWEETKRLAADAHRAFADRVVIGWDIAMLEDAPIIIEGNGNADLDILQRFMRRGLREQRFGQLIAHHLGQRLSGA
jgi:Sugar-transfer associated ATP-grasp